MAFAQNVEVNSLKKKHVIYIKIAQIFKAKGHQEVICWLMFNNAFLFYRSQI